MCYQLLFFKNNNIPLWIRQKIGSNDSYYIETAKWIAEKYTVINNFTVVTKCIFAGNHATVYSKHAVLAIIGRSRFNGTKDFITRQRKRQNNACSINLDIWTEIRKANERGNIGSSPDREKVSLYTPHPFSAAATITRNTIIHLELEHQ